MRINRKPVNIRRQDVINDFAERLRSLRESHGLTQQELANRSGIQVSYVSKIENGKYNISLSHLAALAEAFDMPVFMLLKNELDK